MTKYPTRREDIQATGNPKRYIKKYYSSWVEFAIGKGHGDDTNLVLVTGVDRTRDFAMFSYSQNDDDEVLTCKFSPALGDTSTSVWGTWDTTGFVRTNCGPKGYFSPPSTRTASPTPSGSGATGPVSDEYNQCVFVRYWYMRKRIGIRRVMKAGAGPHNLPGADRKGKELPEAESQSADSGESEPDIVAHTTAPVRSFSIHFAHSSILIDLLQDEEDDFDTVADYIFRVSRNDKVGISKTPLISSC